MYLTYDEFIAFGGTLDIPTFNRYEFKARKLIDSYTANRVSKMAEVPDAVKRCMFELISQEAVFDTTVSNITENSTKTGGSGLVSSFNTDGYSESYAVGNGNAGNYLAELRKGVDNTQIQTISDMLAYEYDDNNVKLLYRGVF